MRSLALLFLFAFLALSHAQETPDAVPAEGADPLKGEDPTSTTGATATAAAQQQQDESGLKDASDFLCVLCQVYVKAFKEAGVGKEVDACKNFKNDQEKRSCQSLWWRHWGTIRPDVAKKEDVYDICAKLVHSMDGKRKSVYCEGGKTALLEVSADPVSVTARDESRRVIHDNIAKGSHIGEHFDKRMHAWIESPILTKEEIPEPKHRSCADVLKWNPAAKSGGYTVWLYNEARTYKMPQRVYCDMETAGGGWMLVRHAAPNKWHPATDKLAGTDVYGKRVALPVSDHTWSMHFKNLRHTEYLFSFGDKSDWMVLNKDTFHGNWGSGPCQQAPTILASKDTKIPYQVLQCMRDDKFSDPILATNCSQGSAFNGKPACATVQDGDAHVVYAEGESHQYLTAMSHHGGSNMFVR